jgi:hypothetical protein
MPQLLMGEQRLAMHFFYENIIFRDPYFCSCIIVLPEEFCAFSELGAWTCNSKPCNLQLFQLNVDSSPPFYFQPHSYSYSRQRVYKQNAHKLFKNVHRIPAVCCLCSLIIRIDVEEWKEEMFMTDCDHFMAVNLKVVRGQLLVVDLCGKVGMSEDFQQRIKRG